ncbi:hypothetical protein SAMN02910298_02813 [Pseudobutyrivibrio sp. YE44]|nr:hypothetical protein SAMN02910298_02813 [Pseudobutyrivibrio sp. YE44]
MEQISLTEKYISITGKGPKPSFGGSQEWFSSTQWKNVRGQGCGLIAAVDCALYISGVNDLNIQEYDSFVEQFLSERKLARLFLHEIKIRKYDNLILSLGILPIQISKYLNKRIRILGAKERFRWNGIHGHKNMYEKIKQMISKNIPVIWSLYSPASKIRLYVSLDGGKTFTNKQVFTNSHYVMITGILEDSNPESKHPRMLEISSWGQRFYIDYDEYLDYVGGSLLSKYCSNIMYLK